MSGWTLSDKLLKWVTGLQFLYCFPSISTKWSNWYICEVYVHTVSPLKSVCSVSYSSGNVCVNFIRSRNDPLRHMVTQQRNSCLNMCEHLKKVQQILWSGKCQVPQIYLFLSCIYYNLLYCKDYTCSVQDSSSVGMPEHPQCQQLRPFSRSSFSLAAGEQIKVVWRRISLPPSCARSRKTHRFQTFLEVMLCKAWNHAMRAWMLSAPLHGEILQTASF